MSKKKYLSVNDFDEGWEWETYLMAVAVNALNPTIAVEFAHASIVGFCLYCGESGVPIDAPLVLSLVDDMKAGPGPTDDEGLH